MMPMPGALQCSMENCNTVSSGVLWVLYICVSPGGLSPTPLTTTLRPTIARTKHAIYLECEPITSLNIRIPSVYMGIYCG